MPGARKAAAIPVLDGRICMVTSSGGGRWVVPKGTIDPGFTPGQAALQEAWEEAGLTGLLSPTEPVGSYTYEKYGRTHHVTVFLMAVRDVRGDWPERGLRQREWLTPAEALGRVAEPGLRAIIEDVVGTAAA